MIGKSVSDSNKNSTSNSNKQSWYKSPWLIGWLLLVAVVLAVNAYMISQSINDFPGLVVDDFYERGQDYEENIATKLENNQKWTTQFQLSDIHINKPTTIAFTISDKEGNAAKPANPRRNNSSRFCFFIWPSAASGSYGVAA